MFGPKHLDSYAFPSVYHRRVAECALCLNENINDLDALEKGLHVINELTVEEIKTVTVEQLTAKGVIPHA